ncbi:MAG: DUF2800 domain-containing protein [Gammaproteobacteria bacterium]|nr:DUF2800 domain-containing protein [Gammaproteobacteria bacterium]
MPALHAKLSPSGSKLDLHCAANRREQAKCKRDRSEASDKGTGAHGLGERCLVRGDNTLEYIDWWCGCNANGADFLHEAHPGAQEIAAGVAAFKVDAKMAAAVQMYVSEVRRAVSALPGSKLGVEIRSKINENIWGTTDAAVMQYFGTLHIIDYKNGVTYVDVYQNSQLMLYACGIILEMRAQGIEFTDVKMTIVQPHTREGVPIRSYPESSTGIHPNELIKWLNEVYLPAANATLNPSAQFSPGDWCKSGWCDARHDCPALAGLINQAAQGMFSPAAADRPAALPAPIAMTPEQRRIVLDNRDLVTDWISKVYAFEYGQHKQGQGTWGKLVKGQNARKWANPNTVEANLSILLANDIYVERKLKSPAQVETALMALGHTKAQAYNKIKDMISLRPGQPRLVAMDAKGTVVNPVETMFTNH